MVTVFFERTSRKVSENNLKTYKNGKESDVYGLFTDIFFNCGLGGLVRIAAASSIGTTAFLIVVISAAAVAAIPVVMATSATAAVCRLKLFGGSIAYFYNLSFIFHCLAGKRMVEIHLH